MSDRRNYYRITICAGIVVSRCHCLVVVLCYHFHSISYSEWCWNCIDNFSRFHHAVWKREENKPIANRDSVHTAHCWVQVRPSRKQKTDVSAHTSDSMRMRKQHKSWRVTSHDINIQHTHTHTRHIIHGARHRIKGRQNFTFYFSSVVSFGLSPLISLNRIDLRRWRN